MAASAGHITVAVVDDQQIVLAGVAAVIGAVDDLRIVGTATDIRGAMELIERTAPDVVLCDVQLGAESGFTLLDHLQGDRPAVVMLSAFDHMGYFQAALERGASGYVLKSALVDHLVHAIRTVAAGGVVFAAQATRRRQEATRPPSRRESGVILLVAAGASNDEIAAELGISAKTVDSHLRTLFDRYRVVSRTELAMYAVAEGWIRATAAVDPRAPNRRWMIDENLMRQRGAQFR